MRYLKDFFESPQNRKMSWAIFVLFAAYFFIRFSYFTIDVFNFDESWFLGQMNANMEEQTKLYLGYSPLFWMFGHVFLKIFGNADLAFGKIIVRMLMALMYFAALLVLYKSFIKKFGRPDLKAFLVILLIISAPVSFIGGKTVTPEYIQLLLFSLCFYFFTEEKKAESTNEKHDKIIWFIAGISSGLKMHAIGVLPFLFLYKLLNKSGKENFPTLFKTALELAKIAIPFSLLGLLFANFPILTNYSETIKTLQSVGRTSLADFISRISILLIPEKDPVCWESICPFYVRDGYAYVPQNLIPPISFLALIFAIIFVLVNKNNWLILALFFVSFIVIETVISFGYASSPWYHVSYLPALLSLLFFLDLEGVSKWRTYLTYGALVIAISFNVYTTAYSIKTDYSFRRGMSDLIHDSAKNTLCLSDTIAQEKPDAVVIGVLSFSSGSGKSYLDSRALIAKYFKNGNKFFGEGGELNMSAIEDLSKAKKIKILFAIDKFSQQHNPWRYAENTFFNKTKEDFEKVGLKEVKYKIKHLPSCSGIKNYVWEVNK